MSVVVLVESTPPDAELMQRLAAMLERRFTDVEFMIVANGVSDDVARVVARVVESLPDSTALFLPQRTDSDVARLVGLENAVSDFALFATPDADELRVLDSFLDEFEPGDEVVIGQWRRRPGSKRFYRALQDVFYRVYDRLNGTRLEPRPAPLRLFSRAAAMHIVNRFDGEMLLKSTVLPGGYPTRIVDCDYEDKGEIDRTLRESSAKAVRLFLQSSTVPLRVVTLLALLACTLGFLYSLYTVGVYLWRKDVQPGWTTLSLQISFVTVMLSLMFGLLSEYVLQIHGALSPRRRHVVARELRSPLSRRATRLNVTDEHGAYKLGAPDLARKEA
ncbi:glycosyltransferase [Alsobacter sp. SYSU M60028]|uniref:Glycosyltransferase n=1 Tax=Alsobacter ponti TaxID=2962936 RepID=A0ABT1L6C1_9HYPH|nr:glycosyltransferase [Alsobacter ponti]MCP8936944.1 glycosyltransferase [Alsobacter ponti]